MHKTNDESFKQMLSKTNTTDKYKEHIKSNKVIKISPFTNNYSS